MSLFCAFFVCYFHSLHSSVISFPSVSSIEQIIRQNPYALNTIVEVNKYRFDKCVYTKKVFSFAFVVWTLWKRFFGICVNCKADKVCRFFVACFCFECDFCKNNLRYVFLVSIVFVVVVACDAVNLCTYNSMTTMTPKKSTKVTFTHNKWIQISLTYHENCWLVSLVDTFSSFSCRECQFYSCWLSKRCHFHDVTVQK